MAASGLEEFNQPVGDRLVIQSWFSRAVPGILMRMISWDIIQVFGICFLTNTCILLIVGVVAEALQQSLTLEQIFRIIPYVLPSMIPYTIPSTILFTTCVVYGRLGADNEILAISLAGVHPARVVFPAAFLGAAASVAIMGSYYWLIPHTHSAMQTRIAEDLEEWVYTLLRRDLRINDPRLNVAVWARQVQGRKLVQAVIKQRGPDGHTYEMIAYAREATLRLDLSRRQLLVRMRYVTIISQGTSSGTMKDRIWAIPLPDSFRLDKSKKPQDLTWTELIQESENLRVLVEATEKEIETGPAAGHHAYLQIRRELAKRQGRAIATEMQLRPALALSCFCFVLAACPVAILFSRRDYLSLFITCYLPIVFVYYPLVLAAVNLAREGLVRPEIVWCADGVVALVGLVLLRLLLRR